MKLKWTWDGSEAPRVQPSSHGSDYSSCKVGVSALRCHGEEVLTGLNLLKAANGFSPAVSWWLTEVSLRMGPEAVSLSCIPGGTCLGCFSDKHFKDYIL